MKLWLRVSAAIAVATIFVLSALHFRQPPDPLIRGRVASAWAMDLLSVDYAVRGEAQNALAQLGDAAVPQLCVLLRKRNSPWQKHLVRLKSFLPGIEYQPKDAVVCRLSSAEMLGILGPAASNAIPDLIASLAFDDTPQAPERALVRIGPASVRPLARAVKEARDPKIRARSAKLLREFAPLDSDALGVLKAATRDGIPAVREQSALSLGASAPRDTDAANVLLRLADDSSEMVRAAAMEALGSIGLAQPAVLEALRGGLGDRSVAVRLAAAKSLWRLDGDFHATVPVLASIVAGYERRWEAVYALAEIGPQAAVAIPALVKVLTEEKVSRPFRTPPSSAFALGKIGPAAIPALSQLLTNQDSGIRTSAVLAFSFMGRTGADGLPKVLPMLHDKNAEVRHIAALTLPAIGAKKEQVLTGLTECLADEDIYVRSAAAAALREIVPEQDWVVQPE